jgi:hypothetical protein
MPAIRTIVALGLAGTAALATGACTGKDPYRPGTAIGTFHVEAKRTANSCGDSAVPPDPWKFDVRLSRDQRTLYWVQGGLPVSGTLDEAKPEAPRATMRSSDTRTVRAADPKRGLGPCSLTRDDTLEATLARGAGAEADFETFTGTLGYRFSPTGDSDCADAIVGPGGDGFADLPCEIRFELTGAIDKSIPAR